MSQGDHRRIELHEQTQRFLDGPLKHARAAALAAALVPLASVAAAPAEAQSFCQSAGICGVVWLDTNNNGLQDAGESVIPGASVTLGGTTVATDEEGVYFFNVPEGVYQITVQIPPNTQPSPANVGGDDTIDSDGERDATGANSVATVVLTSSDDKTTDFGFWMPPVQQPGTGTPGYWKNHAEAWPVPGITIGGVLYPKAEAIALIDKPGKDRTLTMFSSLVSAKLNLLMGNDSSCVAPTIALADEWMATYGPVGRGVHAASYAWKVGEPLHRLMDNYNNGMLCAPHRD